jgi:hypothetical protein
MLEVYITGPRFHMCRLGRYRNEGLWTGHITFELGYNVMKGTEYFVSL